MKAMAWLVVGACGMGVLACGKGVTGDAPAERAAAGQGGEGDRLPGGGGEGGGAPECSGLADEQGESLTVRIVNDTGAAIHLGDETHGCAAALGWRFVVTDEMERRLAPVGDCGTCRDVLNDIGGCPSICLNMPALTLEPGGHADLPWDGLFSEPMVVPKGCDSLHNPQRECRKATRPAPGRYTFSARAGRQLSCETTDAGCTECRPRESGGCERPQELVASLSLEATAEITLADRPELGVTAPIELVFED